MSVFLASASELRQAPPTHFATQYGFFCVWLLLYSITLVCVHFHCCIVSHCMNNCSTVNGHLRFQFLLWIMLLWPPHTHTTLSHTFLLGMHLDVKLMGHGNRCAHYGRQAKHFESSRMNLPSFQPLISSPCSTLGNTWDCQSFKCLPFWWVYIFTFAFPWF